MKSDALQKFFSILCRSRSFSAGTTPIVCRNRPSFLQHQTPFSVGTSSILFRSRPHSLQEQSPGSLLYNFSLQPASQSQLSSSPFPPLSLQSHFILDSCWRLPPPQLSLTALSYIRSTCIICPRCSLPLPISSQNVQRPSAYCLYLLYKRQNPWNKGLWFPVLSPAPRKLPGV